MNSFTLKPCGNNLIVKPDAKYQPSKESGIVVPKTVESVTNRGVVVAAGPGERLLGSTDYAPIPAKVGDRVMFGKLRGYDFYEKGERYVMVDARDVLAVEQ